MDMIDKSELTEEQQAAVKQQALAEKQIREQQLTLMLALGVAAPLANCFQLIKVEGHLRVSFSEMGVPTLASTPRIGVLLPDQTAKDLAKNILEYYEKLDQMLAEQAATQPQPGTVQ